MSLSSWWKSLFKFKKKPETRTEPWRVTSHEEPDPFSEDGFNRTLQIQRFQGAPQVRPSSYLDRQGYPLGRGISGRVRDQEALRADQAKLAADLAEAEVALLQDELDLAEQERERAKAEVDALREHSQLSHELDHHYDHEDDAASHRREDFEADLSAAETVDNRPILPSGAVDPTWTANPPQDPTPAPEPAPARTDERQDADFYGVSDF